MNWIQKPNYSLKGIQTEELQNLGFSDDQAIKIVRMRLPQFISYDNDVVSFVKKNIDAGLSINEVIEKLEELEKESSRRPINPSLVYGESRKNSGCMVALLIIIAPTILLSLLVF